ncbi:probable ATP-dependent RNA helicase DDX20, partial [Nephila pilipes]
AAHPQFDQPGPHHAAHPQFDQPGPHYAQPGPHYAQPGPHFAQPSPHFAQPSPHFAQPSPHYSQPCSQFQYGTPDMPNQGGLVDAHSNHHPPQPMLTQMQNPYFSSQYHHPSRVGSHQSQSCGTCYNIPHYQMH